MLRSLLIALVLVFNMAILDVLAHVDPNDSGRKIIAHYNHYGLERDGVTLDCHVHVYESDDPQDHDLRAEWNIGDRGATIETNFNPPWLPDHLNNPGVFSIDHDLAITGEYNVHKHTHDIRHKHDNYGWHTHEGYEHTHTASEPIARGVANSLSSKKGRSVFASKVAMDKVIFNEIRNAADDKNDWIELKNISDEDVPLGDWEISIVIKSAPRIIPNTAAIAKEDVDIVAFPEDYTLPAGGILLIVNTHPRETDLIAGQEITDEESDPDMLPQYLITSEMKLPDVPYLLILRSARDKNGKPEAFEDIAGNYFRGFVDYSTQVFPLLHTARPANRRGAGLTQGQAWQRVDIERRGYTKAAWAVSGYQSGIGYKPKSALATSLGTPGYPNDIVADDSLAGRITFSEVMYATPGGLFSQPQWIELYNNTDTAMLPINLKGWRLVVEARDSKHRHRYSVIELVSDLYIAPTRTVLLVTRNRRHSGHLTEGQVYNLNRHGSSFSKLGLRKNRVIPAEGFALKLFAPDGTLVDSAGNLDGKRFVDIPSWALPSGYTEDGERTSLLRRYDDGRALIGTEAASWVRAADVALPLKLYYGHETDIGSPGFYREVKETVMAAPTRIKKRLQIRKWGVLKKK